ncbi:trypsin-like [Mixophyes fleayi]|uniref:trypsin-like n=1 Tax=Mixophyes fleayi TaxID=3061075 RepID=UPI003F4DA961
MFVLLVAALLGPSVKAYSIGRIIGGEECDPHSQPWQAALYYFDRYICGGVLIHESWILSAAHCKAMNIQIRLGEHNRQVHEDTEQLTYAEKIYCHPEYNNVTNDNDIMLLKLASPAVINDHVILTPLPTELVEDGTNCTISGWGSTTSPGETYPDVLQCLDISIVSASDCQQFYPNDPITDNMICAGILEGGKDSCQGDSGGPLVCSSTLQGITSWGNPICAEPNKPGIYTKVINYLAWIDDVMKNEPPETS